MCGIVGVLAAGDSSRHDPQTIIGRMTEALTHRGPDAGACWHDDRKVLLGHRRLAVVDLSPAGAQPMTSGSGRYVIVFNGEIYNFASIRRDLEKLGSVVWRGHSDTEVALAAFEVWGVVSALERFSGMFAMAVWDKTESRLYLARDRLGEKPLYYGWLDGTLIFASELKALRLHPQWKGEIDPNAIGHVLRLGYIPAPGSIYKDVFKLPPGSYLEVADPGNRAAARPMQYWCPKRVAANGLAHRYRGSDVEAVDTLESLLRSVIGEQMVADVPLGAFLSGGIDSSAVVALMQAQSARPVRTFTIGFDESAYDEAVYGRAVAKHLGTDHSELYVTPRQAMDIIPQLARIYDEPFADASQLPTCLITRLAREHVTVCLSGDGGDEMFGGYNRYFWADTIWRRTRSLPTPAKSMLARCLTGLSVQHWDRVYQTLAWAVPPKRRVRLPGDKLHKLAEVLPASSEADLYDRLISLWTPPLPTVAGDAVRSDEIGIELSGATLAYAEKMMLWDTLSYLPDDILVKVDRAAMAVGLETRLPLLDHRVTEFAWTLPLSFKIRDQRGKWILRQVLYRHVPARLVERPKMGFGVPIDDWLRGPLREWAEDLLSPVRMRQDGIFRVEPIRKKWEEHVNGGRNWQYPLWSVLMFQAWLRTERADRV